MYKTRRFNGRTWFKANHRPIKSKHQKERFKKQLKIKRPHGITYKVRCIKTKKGWNVYTHKRY